MITELDLLHKVIEIVGILLIINAIFVAFSSNYYFFLNKTFFIQPLSEKDKKGVREFVSKSRGRERFPVAIICVLLGIMSVVWSFSGYFSFGYIAVIALILAFLLNKKENQ